jgi:hypothetical protein
MIWRQSPSSRRRTVSQRVVLIEETLHACSKAGVLTLQLSAALTQLLRLPSLALACACSIHTISLLCPLYAFRLGKLLHPHVPSRLSTKHLVPRI